MSAKIPLFNRFGRELVPTMGQVLLVVAASAALIVAGRSAVILRVFGITTDGVNAAGATFQEKFHFVLNSPIVGSIVLIMFWAAVGMIVYLVCWSLYGVYIQARNEVAIKVSYMNSGKWQGPWATLGIKVLCALGLILLLMLLVPGNALWQLMAVPFFDGPSLGNTVALAGAIIGLSSQLYLILVGAQLTFTPWFNEKAFTD